MKQFIGEEIKVEFDKEFTLAKNPPCPISFEWREEIFGVNELLSSWSDYERKGKKARNMRITHIARARKKGSWGVGRFYFKVKDKFGKIVVIYYDRSPKNVFDKKGRWILFSIEKT